MHCSNQCHAYDSIAQFSTAVDVEIARPWRAIRRDQVDFIWIIVMKKMAVLLSILGFAVFPSQGEVAYAAGAVASAASGHDPVQHCLDLVQLNVAGKITPALPVTSHPVQSPPRNLPIRCLAGNLTEIKNALKNQIANCQRKSAKEKAQTFQFGCRMVKNED